MVLSLLDRTRGFSDIATANFKGAASMLDPSVRREQRGSVRGSVLVRLSGQPATASCAGWPSRRGSPWPRGGCLRRRTVLLIAAAHDRIPTAAGAPRGSTPRPGDRGVPPAVHPAAPDSSTPLRTVVGLGFSSMALLLSDYTRRQRGRVASSRSCRWASSTP